MLRTIRRGTLLALLAWTGSQSIGNDLSAADTVTTPVVSPKAPYQPEQTILLKQVDKPDRLCKIMSVSKRADGVWACVVRTADTNEIMTILDPRPAVVAIEAEAPKPTVAKKPEAITIRVAEKDESPVRVASMKTGDAPAAMPVAPSAPGQVISSRVIKSEVCESCKPGDIKVVAAPKAAKVAKAAPTPVVKVAPVVVAAPAKAIVVVETPKEVVGSASISMPAPVPAPVIVAPVASVLPVSASVPEALTMPTAAELGRMPVAERVSTCLKVIETALKPSDRELACEYLSGSYAASKEVRSALMATAAGDPAPSVRATCIRCLSKCSPNEPGFAKVVEEACKDANVRIREEGQLAAERTTRK